jgi:prepilin-type N-terminal cleavage/methylation domain-containing protein
MRKVKLKMKNKGFTLIELFIVLAIFSIITTMVFTVLSGRKEEIKPVTQKQTESVIKDQKKNEVNIEKPKNDSNQLEGFKKL